MARIVPKDLDGSIFTAVETQRFSGLVEIIFQYDEEVERVRDMFGLEGGAGTIITNTLNASHIVSSIYQDGTLSFLIRYATRRTR